MKWLKDQRFEGYSFNHLQKDMVSGILVGIVAIPLAMAFAIASGVRPEYGIYTTIIAGFLIALLGGSRFQIAGPTGAFVPILFAIVSQYGYENLLVIGVMAGTLLVLMGVLRLGSVIHYIPRPVLIGFTTGIAVLIFVGQLPSFLGLHNLEAEEEFIYKFKELLVNLGDVNGYSILTATICLLVTLLVPRYFPRIPGALVGLVVSTLMVVMLFPGKVATIGSTFGFIPNQIPHIQIPDITFSKLIELFVPACIVAMLGGIESLLSAVVADGMTNTRHRSNRELIGQGIANIVTPLFGGIPATGAIARTATNIRNGGTSPVSGMIHSLFVLMVLLAFSSYTSHIPLASMAPVLMIVAWNMSERKEFLSLLKIKTEDSIVLLATFLLTVIIDLVVGVSVGLGLAFILFGVRMSRGFVIRSLAPKWNKTNDMTMSYSNEDVHVFVLEGPIFFGSAKQLKQLTEGHSKRVLVLCMSKVPYIDTTGKLLFSHLVQKLQTENRTLILTGIQEQPKGVLQSISSLKKIGENEFSTDIQGAIQHVQEPELDRLKAWQCVPSLTN